MPPAAKTGGLRLVTPVAQGIYSPLTVTPSMLDGMAAPAGVPESWTVMMPVKQE